MHLFQRCVAPQTCFIFRPINVGQKHHRDSGVVRPVGFKNHNNNNDNNEIIFENVHFGIDSKMGDGVELSAMALHPNLKLSPLPRTTHRAWDEGQCLHKSSALGATDCRLEAREAFAMRVAQSATTCPAL